jgi:hypothetical protein
LRSKTVFKIVIPGLTRNPVFTRWIPACAGMTNPKLFSPNTCPALKEIEPK